MRFLTTLAILGLVPGWVLATPSGACEASAPRATAHGAVSRIECGNAEVGGKRATILFDGVPVLSSKELYKEDSDDSLGYFVYSREADPQTACPDRLFLIDASKRPVKVIAFGVQGACNQFESARWGEKASVITLKKGVHFVFEGGTVKAPKAGSALWKSIEPPRTGNGLAQDAAMPFVQEVAPPPRVGASTP